MTDLAEQARLYMCDAADTGAGPLTPAEKLISRTAHEVPVLLDEIERLREALDRITQLDGANAPTGLPTAEFLRQIARDALEGSGFYEPADPDYSPAYQDEYQRLWHRAQAEYGSLDDLAKEVLAAIRDHPEISLDPAKGPETARLGAAYNRLYCVLYEIDPPSLGDLNARLGGNS